MLSKLSQVVLARLEDLTYMCSIVSVWLSERSRNFYDDDFDRILDHLEASVRLRGLVSCRLRAQTMTYSTVHGVASEARFGECGSSPGMHGRLSTLR